MTVEIFYILGSVLLVSVISLIGVVTLSWNARFLRKCISFLVALAIGALLGDAFIHLIPEALAEAANPDTVPLLILIGILIFFVLEKLFHWHHGMHGAEEHTELNCPSNDPHCRETDHKHAVRPLGNLILMSDSLHNFLDGLVIASSYFVSIEVGIATTIAVILHEIPQEIGDFGILIHSGFTKSKALLYNFFSALFAVLGAFLALLLGNVADSFIVFVLPIAAGSFIYIASSDLTPELHKQKISRSTLLQVFAIILGIGLMYGLVFVEPHSHSHNGHSEEHTLIVDEEEHAH